VLLFAFAMASRSEHAPFAETSSAVVLTLIVAADACAASPNVPAPSKARRAGVNARGRGTDNPGSKYLPDEFAMSPPKDRRNRLRLHW
jgi:hypothetical protein